MTIGIDLGKKTTGIAISQNHIASPYKTITHKSQKEALKKISEIIIRENIDTAVIGYVEGKIKKMFENFAKSLSRKHSAVKIVLWDETLTSRHGMESMIKLGIAKKRRKNKEHEFAAGLILQSYLESQ